MTNATTRRVLPAVWVLLAASYLGLCQSAALQAQFGRRDDADIPLKNSPKFLAAFRDASSGASQSTVRIRCDGDDVALGAIVGADGWIVTKASELKGTIVCRLRDGRELPARIVGVSEPYDLAMLKIEAKELKSISWRDSTKDSVGDWLATTGMSDNPVAVGVLGVAARKITGPELSQRSAGGGFLGIRVASDKKGAKVAGLIAKSAAAKAGFEADDIIVAVSGKTITDPEALFKALQKTRPGQVVSVRVLREEEELELKPKLDKRPMGRQDFQNRMGGKLSDRRSGFPTILQHDAVVKPSDCGGPVVDLDGKVIGINIARAGRTETYAIPAEEVKPLLKELQSGKLAPTK